MKKLRAACVWLTIVMLVCAPLSPVAGAVLDADAADAHAAHAAMGHGQAAETVAADTLSPDNNCPRHAACDGQCCNACAQCLAAGVSVLGDSPPRHPVQTAVVPKLHAHLSVTLPNRPPKASR